MLLVLVIQVRHGPFAFCYLRKSTALWLYRRPLSVARVRPSKLFQTAVTINPVTVVRLCQLILEGRGRHRPLTVGCQIAALSAPSNSRGALGISSVKDL